MSVSRFLAAAVLLPLAALLLLAVPAAARGGRHAAPPAMRGPGAVPAPAAEPEDCPPPIEEPTREPPPGVPPPTSAGVDGLNAARTAGRRVSAPGLGIVDWVHWYEANRERFENLRARLLLTETNPIFAVGEAQGPSVGRPTVRVGDPVRDRILGAFTRALQPESGNWIHTEGAAYVALGRVAASPEALRAHFAALETPERASRYVQESAVLGLAHLVRGDTERRLSPPLLDRARHALLDVLAGADYGLRARAFAGVALALLADQPTGHEEGGVAWTAEHLFRIWITRDLPDEVQVGILLGLAELDPKAVPRVIPLVLEGCALRGREWPRPASAIVRAHTVVALARLGDARNAAAVAKLLAPASRATPLLRQAAAIAAAVLAERDAAARPVLGRALLGALDASGEPGGRHLGWIALGRILAAQVAAGDTALLEGEGAGARLLDHAERGPAAERCFAALALGLAAAQVGHEVDSAAWQMFRFRALETLRSGVEDLEADGHTRSAFCVGLGLAGDRQSGARLLALLADADRDPELRAYAGLALGLMGDARQGVIPALTRALAEPRSEVLRMRAATALGLLGGGGIEEREAALRILLLAFRTTRSQAGKGQIAVTLGRLGDARAVEPLVAVLEDDKEAHLNRAIACAALGLVGAEELAPALAPLREHCHYMSGSDVVFELLDLL